MVGVISFSTKVLLTNSRKQRLEKNLSHISFISTACTLPIVKLMWGSDCGRVCAGSGFCMYIKCKNVHQMVSFIFD